MTRAGAVEVVRRWHDAVNARDVDGALALCREDVAVGGPRGTGHGHDVMRAWLQRSGIALEPQEDLVEHDGRVVVHELARWRPVGEAPAQVPVDAPAETWVAFEVADGLVASVRRYESADEVPAAPDSSGPAPGGQVSEVGRLEEAETPIFPDQATAGYPDAESGRPEEGSAGPNARPRDDRPGPR